jgi:hypothetical protein
LEKIGIEAGENSPGVLYGYAARRNWLMKSAKKDYGVDTKS